MNRFHKPLTILTACLITIACSWTLDKPAATTITDSYHKEIESWHAKRNARLLEPDSWLSLIGLFWLEQGTNSFGSNTENDLVFPGPAVPDRMGHFVLQGDSVHIEIEPDIVVTHADTAVRNMGMVKDIDGEASILKWSSLSWYAIQRGERIGIRLKDSQHPNLLNFSGTELYDLDLQWRVPATLTPVDSGTSVEITNVLGDIAPSPVPGILSFMIGGKEYKLTPIADPGDEKYFIIFGDATNGIETYGAGRFLVIPAVDEAGQTWIDFNKAYNMPCVFSPYATCPLPPEENILTVEIRAGEKNYDYGGGH